MAIVLPDPARPVQALLALRHAQGTALLRKVLSWPRADLPESAREPCLLLQTRLGQLVRTRATQVNEVLLEPSISVLLTCGALSLALPRLALELGVRKLLGAPVRFADPPSPLLAPSCHALLDVAAGVTLIVEDGWLELAQGRKKPLRCAISPKESALKRLASPLAQGSAASEPVGDFHALLLYDSNPLAMNEAHPDKAGNALSLGGRSLGEWQAALRASLETIAQVLPELHAELCLFHRYFIPVGFEPEKHLSASYREYLGAMYLTLHPSQDTMTEAIIHEFQHNKLNLLSWHDALLENGSTFAYRSPVRPDIRPLIGILLAAHAFVPVAELYYRRWLAGERSVRQRLDTVIALNQDALEVLTAHGQLTPLGRRVLMDLSALHRRHTRSQ